MKTILLALVIGSIFAGCASTSIIQNQTCKPKITDAQGNPIVSECKKVDL